MGSFSRYVVVCAALAVLVVLMTPALDELPCTAVHKPITSTAIVSTPLLLLPALSTAIPSIEGIKRLITVDNVRSVTCTFLC